MLQRRRIVPRTPAVAELSIFECESDSPRLAIPRPELQLVARYGAAAKGGLDVHAFGMGQTVHRKTIRGGQRAVAARLRLGVPDAVFGVSAAVLADRAIPIEALWGDAVTRRLLDRLSDARDAVQAASILETAIEERLGSAHRMHCRLALEAAERLERAHVNAVADELGVSERHLRRLFRDAIGVSPKAFAKLARFRAAVRAATKDPHASWASIAARTGYYDQAHLIAEFRAISGVAPRALMIELRAELSTTTITAA